jgi:alpha-tubulin suppressor-like RCC1 family protein
VKISDRSRAASLRRLAILAPVLALAILSCKKDATGPTTPVKLAFTVQPSNTIVDSSIVPAVAVTVEDESGNVVTTSNALITVTFGTNPNNANLSGTATVVAVAGVATFPYLSINLAGTGYTLIATESTAELASATSAAFNVTVATTGLFASVNTGGNSTCGVTTSGAAWCWGNNSLGQLGNGATTNSSIPSAVAGGLSFGSVSVGSLQFFSCGLATSGAAYCWGYNDYGQLGSGNFANSTTPVAVTGNLTFTSLSAGEGGQACGLVSGGAAYCWGYNGSGQLGSGSIAYSSSPLPVSGGLSFSTISAGENGTTCAVTTAGAGYCWGYNADGELGNGTTTLSSTPVAVSGGLTFKSISAGFSSSCGLTASGAAWCWGDNIYGELGNGTTVNSTTPVAVGGGLVFSAVSAGDAFACGITTSGAAYCWGYNGQGQLGNGSAARSGTPVAVLGGLSFASISAGYASACAVTPGGAAYCWGDNAFGELGNQAIGGASLTPVLVVTPH